MSELLRRSGKVLLHIKVLPPTDRTAEVMRRHDECMALILEQLHRIRVLHLASPQPLSQRCAKMLAGAAPQLRRVSLGGLLEAEDLRADTTRGETGFTSLGMLKQANSPRLEYLELNVLLRGLRFDGPFAGSLKRLSIYNVEHWTVDHPWPRAADVLDMLKALPSLEVLDFTNACCRPNLPAQDDSRQVWLPRLREIELHADAKETAMLLGHIDAPSLTRLDLIVTSNIYCDDPLRRGLHHALGDIGPVQCFEIEYSDSAPLHILGSTAGDPDGPRKRVEFKLILPNDQEFAPDDLWHICHSILDLRELPAFSLKTDGNYIMDYTVLSMLETMCQVKTFTLTGPRRVDGSLASMISTKTVRYSQKRGGFVRPRRMHDDDDTDSDDTDDKDGNDTDDDGNDIDDGEEDSWLPPYLLPGVETIVLHQESPIDDRSYRTAGSMITSWVKPLRNVLQNRARDGYAVKELRLRDCLNPNEAIMSALRDVMEECGGQVVIETTKGVDRVVPV